MNISYITGQVFKLGRFTNAKNFSVGIRNQDGKEITFISTQHMRNLSAAANKTLVTVRLAHKSGCKVFFGILQDLYFS